MQAHTHVSDLPSVFVRDTHAIELSLTLSRTSLSMSRVHYFAHAHTPAILRRVKGLIRRENTTAAQDYGCTMDSSSSDKSQTETLKLYDGLCSYFLSEDNLKQLVKLFSSSMTEICLLFYQSVLTVFTSFNIFL